MSLVAYRRKRHFGRTAEPRGRTGSRSGSLTFVVQKHAARRLHYDFRLEADGVLKSWAVPKGPSLNPSDRRLAVMVEDHPLDYRKFEGVIPHGNYGAGSVIVWDEGTYTVSGITDRRAAERAVVAGIAAGRIHVVLKGKKLRGEFSLVRMNRGDGKNWLLLKKSDDTAGRVDVTADVASVKTGRTLVDVAGRRRRKIAIPPAAPKGKMPHAVRPMLATPVAEPFDRPGWLFEIKWDGYRTIAEVQAGRVRLYSRNHVSFDHKFAPIAEALRDLGHDAVLDGEVVAVDELGRSSFQLLQNYQKTGRGRLVYYVFDLLHLDGRDLRPLPLTKRKHVLAQLIAGLPRVLPSEHVADRGVALFRAAEERGLEGIIAKDGNSPYREGRRGGEWLKIKTVARQEAVIGGFTAPRGSRTGLGALLLGVYEADELVYIGHTGGGLNGEELDDLRKRLDPLRRRSCPFLRRPKPNAPVQWVEPELVCEVAFKEWTGDGIMRQPIFVGLREDKPAGQVRRELSKPIVAPSAARRTRPESPGDAPPLTHPTKVLWPAEGYTKQDLADYYRSVAPVLLPYLRDRPQSLHRHPNGIAAEGFFQKDVSAQPPPSWVETTLVPHESGRSGRYIVCQDENTLLYLANLGCIELNPWLSRVGSLDRPDFLVIDLDPEAVPFARVIEAAQAVHGILDRAGAECLCKTSGKTGLHLCVPLGAKYEYAVARQFAELVANIVNGLLPETTSIIRSPALRQKRVYLDYLQNRYGQTIASPYSVRPVPGACVSTPLKWNEVRRDLDPARFTIRTLAKRLDRLGDLWAPILGRGVDLELCLRRLTVADQTGKASASTRRRSAR
jgi:bifunctional non-homologous end joining protein LigD